MTGVNDSGVTNEVGEVGVEEALVVETAIMTVPVTVVIGVASPSLRKSSTSLKEICPLPEAVGNNQSETTELAAP